MDQTIRSRNKEFEDLCSRPGCSPEIAGCCLHNFRKGSDSRQVCTLNCKHRLVCEQLHSSISPKSSYWLSFEKDDKIIYRCNHCGEEQTSESDVCPNCNSTMTAIYRGA